MKGHWVDSLFQMVLGIAAVAALNRLLYHDRMLVAIGYAVGVVGAYWLGRAGVRLVRRLRQAQRLTDE